MRLAPLSHSAFVQDALQTRLIVGRFTPPFRLLIGAATRQHTMVHMQASKLPFARLDNVPAQRRGQFGACNTERRDRFRSDRRVIDAHGDLDTAQARQARVNSTQRVVEQINSAVEGTVWKYFTLTMRCTICSPLPHVSLTHFMDGP